MKTAKQLVKRAVEITKELEKCKGLYKELDYITDRLRHAKGARWRYKNYVIELADNFETKNTVFRPAAVRRYELVITYKPKLRLVEPKERKKDEAA